MVDLGHKLTPSFPHATLISPVQVAVASSSPTLVIRYVLVLAPSCLCFYSYFPTFIVVPAPFHPRSTLTPSFLPLAPTRTFARLLTHRLALTDSFFCALALSRPYPLMPSQFQRFNRTRFHPQRSHDNRLSDSTSTHANHIRKSKGEKGMGCWIYDHGWIQDMGRKRKTMVSSVDSPGPRNANGTH